MANLIHKVPSQHALVRVGDGDPKAAKEIAQALTFMAPDALVEIVDESGTSQSSSVKGLKRDQGSAAKIAFRRGAAFRQESRASRSR